MKTPTLAGLNAATEQELMTTQMRPWRTSVQVWKAYRAEGGRRQLITIRKWIGILVRTGKAEYRCVALPPTRRTPGGASPGCGRHTWEYRLKPANAEHHCPHCGRVMTREDAA